MGGERAVADPFAGEEFRTVVVAACRFSKRLGADRPQIGGNFIGEHFLEAKPEQVWRIPAIWPRGHSAAEACRATRSAVTACATVREASATVEVGAKIACPVIEPRSLPLHLQKLPLKELTPTANGAEGVPRDEKRRGIRR